MSNEPATSYDGPTPCPVPNMSLVGKRIVVMQSSRGGRSAIPVAVHDGLDNAIADLGKRAAEILVSWCDTESNALYLRLVDR